VSHRDFEDDALSALRASAILSQALDSGITLVRDAGARNTTASALQHAIDKGYIEGPRFVICGQIVGVTGGHGTEGDRMEQPKWLRESDSPHEWRKNIRQNFKMGADFVKVTPPFTRDEIELAVEEAHNFGARIAVDAAGQSYPGMMMVEWAVTAGADTIEHLAPMKNEAKVIAMMKEKGTILVPTLHATRRFAGERWDSPRETDTRELTRPEDYEDRFRKMHAAGVVMAIGTDTGGKDQGEIGEFYAEEIRRFLSWGYTATEVLQAATRIGAEAAGLGDRLGALTPGKWADLIIVPGDVMKDPASVVHPSWVIKDGTVLRSPGRSRSRATSPNQ
jgi:imidazolonepropionase-like amidohydrolase